MPDFMLRRAAREAYGTNSRLERELCGRRERADRDNPSGGDMFAVPRIRKAGKGTLKRVPVSFKRGDSVMVYPDKKIGIVCETVNDQGVLRVQLSGSKISREAVPVYRLQFRRTAEKQHHNLKRFQLCITCT